MNIKVKLSELAALAPLTARHLESRLREASPTKKQLDALRDERVIQIEYAIEGWSVAPSGELPNVRDRAILCSSEEFA